MEGGERKKVSEVLYVGKYFYSKVLVELQYRAKENSGERMGKKSEERGAI